MLSKKNKTILVIEDDTDIRNSLDYTLQALEYKVVTAEDGLEAMILLKTHSKIDLIIADIRMPNMNGIEFRKSQLLTPHLKEIPIIFLSANNFFRDEVESLGPYEFLNKPIDIDDMENILTNFFMLQSKIKSKSLNAE